MNINEIATAAVDRLEPTLNKIIESHASATHPEIINGRKVMIERRERMIETVSLAIADAVNAVKMCNEMQEATNTTEMVKICATVSPHTPSGLCTTAEAVEWLVDRHKEIRPALWHLEEIRTEKLAAKGLTAEASAVSAARVLLQRQREVDEPADGSSGRTAENAKEHPTT